MREWRKKGDRSEGWVMENRAEKREVEKTRIKYIFFVRFILMFLIH